MIKHDQVDLNQLGYALCFCAWWCPAEPSLGAWSAGALLPVPLPCCRFCCFLSSFFSAFFECAMLEWAKLELQKTWQQNLGVEITRTQTCLATHTPKCGSARCEYVVSYEHWEEIDAKQEEFGKMPKIQATRRFCLRASGRQL
ncbi:hypothetical protein AAC387_Pa01g2015 [Persea americana]